MILIRGNVEREADGAIAEKLMKDGFRPLEEEGAAEAVPSETVEKNLDEMTVDELKNKKLWFYGLQSQPRMEK